MRAKFQVGSWKHAASSATTFVNHRRRQPHPKNHYHSTHPLPRAPLFILHRCFPRGATIYILFSIKLPSILRGNDHKQHVSVYINQCAIIRRPTITNHASSNYGDRQFKLMKSAVRLEDLGSKSSDYNIPDTADGVLYLGILRRRHGKGRLLIE